MSHEGPWTEEDLVGLPDDGQRYELLEGALLVSPPPAPRHQRVSFKLARVLDDQAPPELVVLEAIGVRHPSGVFIPDLLVADRRAAAVNTSGILDSAAVRMVVEIVSPGSRLMDHTAKPAAYQTAGIQCFWLVELQDDVTIRAYDWHEGVYAPAGVMAGQPMEVATPFQLIVDPADLHF